MFIRPEIAYSFIELNKAVMENKGQVSSKLKRMIGFVSSRVTGCNYCQAHTIRAAERYGASDKQLENIFNGAFTICSSREPWILCVMLK